ncbi:MAG: hypothetical protein H0W29_08280 [Gemmatimonadales bacterium]|nr:hypothetical protein [Gemmatimonadales bacterium]
MFIELTDHLRCPADHEERFMVLLPDRLEGRSVVEGQLGCPVCGRTFALKEGVLDVGGGPGPGATVSALSPDALVAFAGVNGPGGYLVLVGPPADRWLHVAGLLPGVGLVAVNPGQGTRDEPGVSVLRGGRLPLKSRSMRGVVLGKGYAGEEDWVREAARVVLPGLRVVGEGETAPEDLIDLMASAGGVWVGTPRR